MTKESAQVLLAATRRAGDELMAAFAYVKKHESPEEVARWQAAVGRSMGAIYQQLLEPLLAEHPDITPKALGGTAPD